MKSNETALLDMSAKQTITSEIDDAQLRDWLLHWLDAERGAEIERQLFVDAELADRIDAVECDLIDDCARGRLTAAEARIVRARGPGRVRFAQALAGLQAPSVVPMPAPARRRIGMGFAIAASLLLAVGVLRWQTLEPVRPAPPTDVASLPVVALSAAQQRGVGGSLVLPVHAGELRLQCEIDGVAADEAARYTLSVSVAGRVAFAAHGLAARSAGPYRFVEAVVPGAALGPDLRRVTVAAENGQDSPLSSWDVQMPASR